MSQKSQTLGNRSGGVQPRRKSVLPFALIALALVAAGVAGWRMWRGAQERNNPSARQASAASSSPASQAPARAGAMPAHVKGDPNAPVLVEEFADMQCPMCATMHAELAKILPEYGSRVRFIYRQYPLVTLHQNALAAALAAEAAGRQDKFWEMQDHLYRNQQAWSNAADVRGIFYDYARTIGLDADRFMRDLRDPALLARVQADMRRGDALGVQSTPTLFVNDRQIPGSDTTGAGVRASLDEALRRAAGQPSTATTPAAAPPSAAPKSE